MKGKIIRALLVIYFLTLFSSLLVYPPMFFVMFVITGIISIGVMSYIFIFHYDEFPNGPGG